MPSSPVSHPFAKCSCVISGCLRLHRRRLSLHSSAVEFFPYVRFESILKVRSIWPAEVLMDGDVHIMFLASMLSSSHRLASCQSLLPHPNLAILQSFCDTIWILIYRLAMVDSSGGVFEPDNLDCGSNGGHALQGYECRTLDMSGLAKFRAQDPILHHTLSDLFDHRRSIPWPGCCPIGLHV